MLGGVNGYPRSSALACVLKTVGVRGEDLGGSSLRMGVGYGYLWYP